MIEKIGKQENLPQKMGIISILKMKIVIFFRFFIFLHVKTFLFSTPCFRYPIFFLNFFLTESDTVGPQLFTWSKIFYNYHIKAPKFVLEPNCPLSVQTLTSPLTKKVLWLLCKILRKIKFIYNI